jgi:DNA-binding MarR family transcriptional regulator
MADPTPIPANECKGPDVDAFRAFMSAHALLVGAIERALSEAELPPLSWHDVLVVLEAQPEGRMRPHELADAIVLSRSGLSRLLDRMEADGLLHRVRCSGDRRGAYAVITDAGHETLALMRPVYRRTVEEHFLPQLGDQAQSVREALDRVSDSARTATTSVAARRAA